MTWPNPCTCTPGTHENGWHEQRSPECLRYERRQWQEMWQRITDYFATLRR